MTARPTDAAPTDPTAAATVESPRAPEAGRLSLVVVVDGQATACDLPARGEIAIGRGDRCDVVIDHPSVSRLHVRLLLGAALTLEDAGSTNGSRPLAPGERAAVAIGDAITIGDVTLLVQERALATRALTRPRPDPTGDPAGVVVASPRMHALHTLLERIAPADISVLLLGETGVGKEVIAATLQRRSRRADGPFLRLNCAALSESLLESELFGHERGAFTGATATKPGLLETAAGGTVLLDEVGELPMAVQVKLLRVLEERAVLRVGGLTPIALDVRFVAATNRDLAAEVARGRFREDLYYRLAGVTITVPPLRERLDELEPLARTFIASFCQRNQLAPVPQLSAAAAAALHHHRWPGNLRELRNLVERAVLLSHGPAILPEHLLLGPDAPASTLAVTAPHPATAATLPATATSLPASPATLLASATLVASPTAATSEAAPAITATAAPGTLDGAAAGTDDERSRIIAALDACAGNQTRAAAVLGISRRTLVYRLDLHGLARPRKPAR